MNAGYGMYSAGINHCHISQACAAPKKNFDYGCSYFATTCDKPLCCGIGCKGVDKCSNSTWGKNMTRFNNKLSPTAGCAYINNTEAGGVLCCREC